MNITESRTISIFKNLL